MKPPIFTEQAARRRDEALALFTRLHELAVTLGVTGVKSLAAELIANINAPFLFTAVGEVKSGKSSFINALLQDEICEVAPEPCTDTVQKIVYSPEPYERTVSPEVKEIGRPHEVLQDIAIVDTPGTNSIIERHQAVTEGFIPQSDLALFVFPAQNPYARTSWELFRFVHHKWHKKIVFILQQADRATNEELAAARAGVAQYARDMGAETPTIFAVSAKLAATDPTASGIPEVWDYITRTVTSGNAFRLKLESLLSTALDVLARAGEHLGEEERALELSKAEADKIEVQLARGRDNTARDLDILRARLLDAYVATSGDACQDFEQGLSLPSLFKNSFKGLFSRRNPFKAWVAELHAEFAQRFQAKVEEISAETGRHVAENLIHFLDRLLEELKEAAGARPESLDAGSVASERLRVVGDAARNVLALISDPELGSRIQPGTLKSLGDQTMLGGFMTAMGAIIAAATHAVVFDVTGGIISTLGALLAINTLALRRRSIIRRHRESFSDGKTRLDQELKEKLAAQGDKVFGEIRAAFAPFFSGIAAMERKIGELARQAEELRAALYRAREELGSLD